MYNDDTYGDILETPKRRKRIKAHEKDRMREGDYDLFPNTTGVASHEKDLLKEEDFPKIKENREVEVNQPLANSIWSFYDKEVQGKRLSQKEKILTLLKHSEEPLSQREISTITGIPRHLVPDRLLVLKRENKVAIVGTKPDLQTKKTVSIYTTFEKANEVIVLG